MIDVVSILKAMHAVLTAAFVVATFALFGISVINRMRIKRVALTWRPLGWKRFPWAPLSFAAIIASIQFLAAANGSTIPTILLAGYALGTLAWIGSSVLSNSIAVCECGIVADIHSRDHAISWAQISDYFEYNRCGVQGVVLLYRGRDGTRRRLDLPVPRRLRASFLDQLSGHLNARVEAPGAPAVGRTALEG